MKSIINFSLNNKFAIWIMTMIVVVAGLYSGMNMKQETIPNIEVPILTVTTVYPGAAPESVADKISVPLEQRIRNLNGVDIVTSTSSENVSSIVVEYKYSKNMDKAEDELRAALADFTGPEGAQATQVSKISLNAFPVVSLSISGDNQSLEDITRIVNDDIKLALEGIDGVGTVAVSGQQVKEVQLSFKPDKLKQYNLSEETVKGIVQASAVKAPLGLFELDKSEKTIVVDGNVKTIDDLRNLAIPAMPAGAATGAPAGAGTPEGAAAGAGAGAGAEATAAAGIPTVKLSEVADVQLVAKAESISRTNGQQSIGINITKSQEANTVTVVNAVKDEMERVKKDYPGVNAIVMLDQGKPIEESVSTMLNKAMFGALFAIIVILLFLRNIRTTIISIVSIPLSLLIAILLLKQFDITLNIMTLGAMTVAIGRVVDDSIVVIENNYRRMSMRSERLKGKELIREATREMFLPIMSSTLVTIAVFLPLGTVSGPIGQLFLPFALTIVFALLASLLVAITVVPMLAHQMFGDGLKKKKQHSDEKPGALGHAYRGVLRWTLGHKLLTFGLAVILLVGSFFLVPVVGVSFLPEEEEKYAMVTYSPAPGQLLSDVEQTALKAEKLILERPGVVNLQYSVGGQNPFSPGPSKSALFYTQYENDTKNFKEEKDKLIEQLKTLDAAGTWGEMDFGGGLGGSKLSLSVYGDNIDEIKAA
ncbi:MAG: efflux RND transporter permease subunit, partial [Paenibacillaceae bacterium]|nr:efflux RND transporter permease subunit [Paenibacillaceae bacterium]